MKNASLDVDPRNVGPAFDSLPSTAPTKPTTSPTRKSTAPTSSQPQRASARRRDTTFSSLVDSNAASTASTTDAGPVEDPVPTTHGSVPTTGNVTGTGTAAPRPGNTHPNQITGAARPRSAPSFLSAFPAYTISGPRSQSFNSSRPEPFPTEVAMAMPPLFPDAPSPQIPFADLSRATEARTVVDARRTKAVQMPVLPSYTPHDQTRPPPLATGHQLGWNYGRIPLTERPHSHGHIAEPFHDHDRLSHEFYPVPASADDDLEYEDDSDDESVSSDSSSVAPVDTVSVTQNGGLLLKSASGIPLVLIDSDSADVSTIFRKHKIQVTNLTAMSDGNNTVNTLHSLATVATGKSNARKFQRWTEDEDDLLRSAVEKSGPGPHDWKRISRKYFRGIRTSVQVSLNWFNRTTLRMMELL